MMDKGKEGNVIRGCAVGNFDGVHRGHRVVLDTLRRECSRIGAVPCAFTFTNHPLELVCPERAPKALQSVESKLCSLHDAGVEPVALTFTPGLMSLTTREFMEMLRHKYNVRLLVAGYDNRFGRGCHDNGMSQREVVEMYRAAGADLGIEVVESGELEGISSSAIRRMIAAGDVAGAARALGRPFEWKGMVVHGKQLGRTLGFPTANLEAVERNVTLPSPGVYAAKATLPDGSSCPAVVNIGTRPTVDGADAPMSVEAHLPGFSGDLYGSPVTLQFVERLRSEKRFDSLDQLKEAIAADCRKALRLTGNSMQPQDPQTHNPPR